MTYEAFERILHRQIWHHNRLNKLYDLKVDLLDLMDDQETAITLLWQEILTPEGYDWLNWYLYEKDGISGNPRRNMQVWDENEKEICKNMHGLWKYLTRQNYFKK